MRSFLLLAVLMAVTHAAPVVRSAANGQGGDGLDGLDLSGVAAPTHHTGNWAQHVAADAQTATNANGNNHGQVLGQDDKAHFLVGTRRR